MRRSPELNLTISRPESGDIPLYLQVVEAIEKAIRIGQIGIGQRVPAERTLSHLLRVSRTTVTAAYRELEARGLLRGFVGRGTLVVASPADASGEALSWSQRSSSMARQANYLSYVHHQPDVVPFELGWQDSSLYPTESLNALLRELTQTASSDLYAPPSPAGDRSLQQAIVQWLEARDIRVNADNVLITAGAQQGLNILARAFLSPGDVVLTERPTFMGALMAFRWAGAEVVGVPSDEAGLQSDALEDMLAWHRPKLIYVMPTFQNPTGAILSRERRQQVLDIAARYRVPIIESDLYGDIYFDQKPPSPLKAMDKLDAVIYQGSFSKIAAPSLRVGWLVVPKGALPALLAAKAFEDLHTSTLTQRLVARFLESRHLDRHLATMRAECRRRRDHLAALLHEHVPTLQFRPPAGGYYLWARLPPPLTTDDLLPAAAVRGVAIRGGSSHMPERGGEDYIRLCFASVDTRQITKGVQRLAAAVGDSWDRLQTNAQRRSPRVSVI
jgi:DNA-binding transcriptional MocR family regulator